jgi:type IV pilus assembly protein PilM
MPKSDAVWGIDIGNCSLKALRCRPGNRPTQVIGDAFDFIEYPKILTQPGADPEELVADALGQFLARNTVRGDRVAISVPGHSGLVRFITLPPVETKKIPDLVKFECRQHIPFDLSEVVWDYQQMRGGLIEEGFALDTEIGLFAMKRDQVDRALEPFNEAGIEIDAVQLAPVALFNYLVFDQMPDLPPPDEFDPESPPPSIVIVSMGTEATDLVVSNGFRVRQRSVPLGGNHFTKALTKELKLTFAKAEHLKRNATAAQDPKAVFQAMRPVFNDLLQEIQRSITYFKSLDRKMQIRKVIALGNAIKLPGLRRFLEQGLEQDVLRVDDFRGLAGPEVKDAPAFKENALGFATCYGLALQALGKGGIQTNLLPGEVVKDRLIREKKPWAVAAAAVLLLGCTISLVSFSRALGTVDEEKFAPSEQKLQSVADKAARFERETSAAKDEFKRIDEIGQNLVSNVEGRLLWLELLKVVNKCLPEDVGPQPPEEVEQRRDLHITSLECQPTDNLENWLEMVKRNVRERNWHLAEEADSEGGDAGDGAAGDGSTDGGADGEGLSGEGYVVQLTGYHYRNPERVPAGQGSLYGNQYVIETLIADLCSKRMDFPEGTITPQDLGISHPVLLDPQRVQEARPIRKPSARSQGSDGYPGMGDPMGGMGAMGGMGYGPGDEYGEEGGYGQMMGGPNTAAGSDSKPEEPQEIMVRPLEFKVQFAWKPITPSERLKKRQEQQQQQQQQEQDAESGGVDGA